MRKRCSQWICILSVLSLLLTACGKQEKQFAQGETVRASILLSDGGEIELELYPDFAPQTVANFVSLCEEHFYDGQIFYRVVQNFLIQTGDPTGSGYYGSEKTLTG